MWKWGGREFIISASDNPFIHMKVELEHYSTVQIFSRVCLRRFSCSFSWFWSLPVNSDLLSQHLCQDCSSTETFSSLYFVSPKRFDWMHSCRRWAWAPSGWAWCLLHVMGRWRFGGLGQVVSLVYESSVFFLVRSLRPKVFPEQDAHFSVLCLVGDSYCLLMWTSALPPLLPSLLALWDLSLTPAFVGVLNLAAGWWWAATGWSSCCFLRLLQTCSWDAGWLTLTQAWPLSHPSANML